MYKVIEDLKSVEVVHFFDEHRKLIKRTILQGSRFYPLGQPNQIEELTGESGYPYYNNIVLVCELGEVIIFQSYGDGEFRTPDGYEEVNKSVVISNSNSSLGYHNGWFVSIDHFATHLYIQRLFEAPLPDLSKLDWKRPYSFEVLHKDRELYYWVHISFGGDAEPYRVLSKVPFSYDEVFSVENINKTLERYPLQWGSDLKLDDYVTSCWEKDGLIIELDELTENRKRQEDEMYK